MKKIASLLGLSLGLVIALHAQSTAYVFQGGLSMGTQRWDNSFEREPLFAYHGALSVESVDNELDNASFIMQLGYHVRGSATRFRTFNVNGFPGSVYTEEFQFNNFSLMLGAKMKKPLGRSANKKYYYFGGIRGDYTLHTNIDQLSDQNPYLRTIYPQIGFIRRWMAGLSMGGGIEFAFSELVGGEIKLSLCPDVTYQYNQPPIGNVIDPFNPGQTTTISERRIRNLSLELSFGIRLLRKVEIIED